MPKITSVSAAGTITVQLSAAVSNRAVYGAQIGGLVGLSDSASKVAGIELEYRYYRSLFRFIVRIVRR